MFKKAFTLAEVLITLAIIGVVAAITIPSVIVNTNQMEFKTGLRKAVSVLNQAITLNKALTGESPYDNDDLYNYLQQNMSVMKTVAYEINSSHSQSNIGKLSSAGNMMFYTTDGMRFDVACSNVKVVGSNAWVCTGAIEEEYSSAPLYESNISAKRSPKNCGSLGLSHNPDGTTEPPCIITVDVNGDRKPSYFPSFVAGGIQGSVDEVVQKYADPNGRLLTDIFSILITDQGAIPYGVVAQKAMYQAQK